MIRSFILKTLRKPRSFRWSCIPNKAKLCSLSVLNPYYLKYGCSFELFLMDRSTPNLVSGSRKTVLFITKARDVIKVSGLRIIGMSFELRLRDPYGSTKLNLDDVFRSASLNNRTRFWPFFSRADSYAWLLWMKKQLSLEIWTQLSRLFFNWLEYVTNNQLLGCAQILASISRSQIIKLFFGCFE